MKKLLLIPLLLLMGCVTTQPKDVYVVEVDIINDTETLVQFPDDCTDDMQGNTITLDCPSSKLLFNIVNEPTLEK